MAVRTLQLRLVFTVGLFIGPVSALTGSNRAISVESQPLSPITLPSPKYNVSLKFLREPEDVVVNRGRNVTLRCTAESSTGNFTISWLYQDNPLPVNDARWQVDHSEVRILNVVDNSKHETNAGNYACLVSNRFGTILSRTAKVEIATIDREVTVQSVELIAVESQSAILQCRVRSNPPADIQWTFNNLPLSNDKRYVPLPNGTLLIRNTRLTDSGKYGCIATNPTLGKSRTGNCNLTVLNEPKTTTKPTLRILSTSSDIVLKGDNVDLMCISFGWPTPTVQWINNKNVTSNESSTYRISNAQPKDSGNYTCVAENLIGKTVQVFQLRVYQKPQFNVTPESSMSPSALTVRVDCQAKGIPPPRITWLKNGKTWNPDVRIKKSWSGLVFIQSVSTDSAIYQCVATNPVGMVWTAVQIEINSSLSPSPPENVTCRPFDDDKVCVTWTRPPNVTNVTAFSVHSYYTVNGSQQIGPESLVGKPKENQNFELMTGLRHNTNYTFYIRMYLQQASDSSSKVTCQTGVKGFRNLDIETLNRNSVVLKWDALSSDTLCNGTQDEYIVQWFRDDDMDDVTSGMTSKRTFIVAGLLPSVDYQFRVIASSYPVDEQWIMYSIPDEPSGNQSVTSELRAPQFVQEDSTTSTSTRLSWERVPNAKYYTVCYVPVEPVQGQCDEEEVVKSYSPKLSITKLKPNTGYLVMVRAHDYKNLAGFWSEPLNITTSADVPSPVIDLNYHTLNASTVCVHWRAPENRNVKHYLLSYTTKEENWSLEKLSWYNISADQNVEQNCGKIHNGLVSTFLLTNLSIEHTYMVIVRAANEVGLGQPCAPIYVKTHEYSEKNDPEGIEGERETGEIEHNQTLGIIMGIFLAGLCIVCCITIILLRRRCLKRRAQTRARAPTSNELRPAVAHYSSHLGAVQVRMEQLRHIDEHEIEHLVPEERTAHIPSVTPDHLDTKGPSNFPNGCVNGPRKSAKLNGNGVNGAVHITENPQFYAFECNGNLAKNKSEPLLRRYEEDSNSNVKPIDVLFRFFDGFNEFKKDCKSKSDESCHETGLNCTALTLLDESHRKLSPVLEPNG